MYESVSVLSLLIPLTLALSGAPLEDQKLIVVLVDGVRWDYMNDSTLPGFARIAENGVRAEYVTPVFPSNSYPNWYSIVTGLYPESHGIIQNYMYDKEKDDMFLMALHSNASHVHWWNDAEPLWVTAEKRAVKTAMYWWDGCQVVIKGKKPSLCEEYASYWVWGRVNKDTRQAMTETLDKFQNEGYRLGMVYYEAVDATGHLRGPESKERKQALMDIDSILSSFQEEITKRNLDAQVNLVIVSDHGMTAIDPDKVQIIDIEKVISLSDIKVMLDRGAVSMIVPMEGREDKVYSDLKQAAIKGLTIYKKSDIPERYHLKNHHLVPPLLLVADEGYFIQSLSDPAKTKPLATRIFRGYHGYDPYIVKDMRTIFYARGPSFKKGFVSEPLEIVDHYNIFCRVLGMEARPNNGTWEKVKPMLTGAALHQDLSKNSEDNSYGGRGGGFSKNSKKGIFRNRRRGLRGSATMIADRPNTWTLLACLIFICLTFRPHTMHKI